MNVVASQGPRGVVVVGGATIVRADGGWRIPSRFAQYLRALEAEFGHVAFFAGCAPEGSIDQVYPVMERPGIKVIPLRYIHATGLPAKAAVAVRDAWQLASYARRLGAAVHFFPAAGGPAGLYGLRQAKALVTYFKSDWIEHTMRHPGLVAPRALYWSLTERVEAGVSDALVFRSRAHMQRIKQVRESFAEIAQPILATAGSGVSRKLRDEHAVVRLLYVGGLYEHKGLKELMLALSNLRTRSDLPEVRLTLAGGKAAFGEDSGGNSLPGWLAELVHHHQLEESVTATGYVDDPAVLRSLYQEADVFVLPSWAEGFPRVVDEAMSYSLPVVTTMLPGISAVLTHERNALLVEPRDADALADALVQVVKDPQLRLQLGQAGYRSFVERVGEGAAAQHTRLIRNAWRKNLEA